MKPGSLEKAGLAVIAAALAAGAVLDVFLPAACGVAAALVLVLVVGSSFRTMLAALLLQILVTAGQLDAVKAALGIPMVGPDEILLLWSVFLWAVALADGRASPAGAGFMGVLVTAFLALSLVAAARGIAAGYPRSNVVSLTRTFMLYSMYFPALWLFSGEDRFETFWKAVLAVSVVAGTLFFLKGLTGSGEGVQYLYSSGLRIGSRQPNAFAVILLILLSRLWLSPRRPPLLMALPVAVLMGACLVLSSTRALWGGVAVAVSSAWILALFRKGGVPGGIGRHVTLLTVTALTALAAITAVSAAGIISTSQMANRIESGGAYSIPIDIGLLSRLISWATILDGAGPAELLAGRGTGAEITYYKPEFGEIWSMSFVDGSFWQLLLDMGIVGAALLAALYGTALLQSARLFLSTTDIERAARAMGVFCSLILLLVASMMGSLLTNYNYVALWAVLLAILQVERNRERKAGAPGGGASDRPVGPGYSPPL